MDYSDYGMWEFIVTLGILSAFVIVANILRRKIGFVRKSLMPTAVLAGFLALILIQTNIVSVDPEILELITYHSIGLGFIALSLRVPHKDETQKGAALKSGALIVSTYLIQGVVGLIITIALAYTVKSDMFMAAGILLPMGYGQGPGQANNIGSLYEQNGFVGGQSFGLAIAAAGFLVACIVGVICLNYYRAKGKIKVADAQETEAAVSLDVYQDKNEIPITESVDKFSIQVSMVLGIYLLTYLFISGVTALLEKTAPGVAGTVSSLLWGFNFIVGSLLAMLCRIILNAFRKTKVMSRQYQNNFLLNRISGFLFDLMIVCGIAAIDLYDLSGLWLPFILLAVAGAVITHIYLITICKRLFPDYYYESYFSMFGMLTGTISSGVLLLKEIDPNFKTPASNNLITGSGVAIVFGAPILIFTAIAYRSAAMSIVTLAACAVYFLALLGLLLKLSKKKSV